MEDKRKNVIVILAGYEPVLAKRGGVDLPLRFVAGALSTQRNPTTKP